MQIFNILLIKLINFIRLNILGMNIVQINKTINSVDSIDLHVQCRVGAHFTLLDKIYIKFYIKDLLFDLAKKYNQDAWFMSNTCVINNTRYSIFDQTYILITGWKLISFINRAYIENIEYIHSDEIKILDCQQYIHIRNISNNTTYGI